MAEFIVDFIAKGATEEEWLMVLIEEGPWHPHEARLQAIQDRLYNCIDALIDGQLAQAFPQTSGKRIVIQLDCYDAPEEDLRDFFERFSQGVVELQDYKSSLGNSPHVQELGFQLNLGTSD